MSYSALSDSFDYLCYRSTAIRNFFLLQREDRLYPSESDVYRHQILNGKVDSRAVRVNLKCVLKHMLVSLSSNPHTKF